MVLLGIIFGAFALCELLLPAVLMLLLLVALLLPKLFGLPTGLAHTQRIWYNVRLLFRGRVVHLVVVGVRHIHIHILFVVVFWLIWFAINFVVPAAVVSVFEIVITIFICVRHVVVAAAVVALVLVAQL